MGHGDHDHSGAHADDGHDGRSFDERAQDWDDQDKLDRARIVAAAIAGAVAPTATTRLLEYGAGTGLVTQFLADASWTDVTLSDPASGMREVMAQKAADGRLPTSAVIGGLDLADEDGPHDEFDLVVMVMALHHVPEPRRVLAGAARAIAPDGHLCIVDLVAEDGSFHAHTDFEVHDGFEESELTAWLSDAGFEVVSFTIVHELVKDDRPYPLFLSIARCLG